jgi:cyclopropane-fatty-acyl-phospholipid synthase
LAGLLFCLRYHEKLGCRINLAYLAGCSLAFQRNTVGIFQTLASKRVKGPAELPPTRADLYEDWS